MVSQAADTSDTGYSQDDSYLRNATGDHRLPGDWSYGTWQVPTAEH